MRRNLPGLVNHLAIGRRKWQSGRMRCERSSGRSSLSLYTSERNSPMPDNNTHTMRKFQDGFYVYGITLPDSGETLMKVGFSRSPNSRLQSFQTACPFRLELSYVSLPMATRLEAMEAERAFHADFSIYRVSGEWFFFPHSGMTDTIDYALDSLRSDNGEAA